MFELMKILELDNCSDILSNHEDIYLYLPELLELKGIDTINNIKHKDNYYHTLQVLKQVCENTKSIKLRLLALFHDIGKSKTKKFINNKWTFHNHEYVGAQMIKDILNRLNITDDDIISYLQKTIQYNGFVKDLCEKDITDSAIRRYIKEVGVDIIYDLLFFAKYDITTKYDNKRLRMINEINDLEIRITNLIKSDKEKQWRCPIDGNLIMKAFNLSSGIEVANIKNDIISAIKNGIIEDTYESAYVYMLKIKNNGK